MEALRLSIADYAIIVSCLIVSTCIGAICKFLSNKQDSNEEFLLAGRSMSVLPVALSMMATFLSALNLVGLPVDIYRFGTPLVFTEVGFVAGMVFTSFVFAPIYHEAKVNTSYQYLELRFGRFSRRLLSFLCLLQLVTISSIALFAPALALNAMAGFPVWLSVVTSGLICTFYCTLGGIKGVIWTDAFQAVLMNVCVIIVIISGAIKVGRFSKIFKDASEGGRLLYPSFDLDFRSQYSIWTILIQGFIISVCSFGTSQVQVQRLLSVENAKKAKRATLWAIPMIVSNHFLTCFCGLVFFSFFRDCDPIRSKLINSPDQLLPYYILSALSGVPGLAGLCISGVFSASLSTVSSHINSLVSITIEDFLRPCFRISNSTSLAKALTVGYGLLTISCTFAVASFGTIIKTTFSINGIFTGLSTAFFLLAILSKKANEKGAAVGILSGTILGLWVCMSNLRDRYSMLPTSIECSSEEFRKHSISIRNSTYNNSIYTSHQISPPIEEGNFAVSYMWNTLITAFVTLSVGYAASLLFNHFQGNMPLDEKLVSPLRLRFHKKKKLIKVPKPLQSCKDDGRHSKIASVDYSTVNQESHIVYG